MQLRSLFLFSLILCLCANAFAQDKIYKKNGDVIDSKIKSVGVKTITYVRSDNLTGPEYTIVKNEVEKIVYQNGSEDNFIISRKSRNESAQKDEPEVAAPADKVKYRPNILSIAPLQFSENGLGAGISYERSLDSKGIIAFYLPVVATFDLNNGTYVNPTTNAVQNGHTDGMFYAMPGIKVYPTGCNGLVRYAIGPSFVIGSGQASSSTYDNNGNFIYQTQTHTVLGMMVNNSLYFNPGPHIYLGLELGLGFSYLNRIGGLNQSTEALVQGGLKIGYRF